MLLTFCIAVPIVGPEVETSSIATGNALDDNAELPSPILYTTKLHAVKGTGGAQLLKLTVTVNEFPAHPENVGVTLYTAVVELPELKVNVPSTVLAALPEAPTVKFDPLGADQE